MLDYIADAYKCILDFVMHPGNYLPEYVMHLIACVSIFAALALAIACLAIAFTIVRCLYVQLILNSAFAICMVYYQVRTPQVELVKADFRVANPKTWPIKYWWKCMKSMRTLNWHFDQDVIEMQNMGLIFDFSPLLYFRVIDTSDKQVRVYTEDGWKNISEETKND